jgi:hypothetical protein
MLLYLYYTAYGVSLGYDRESSTDGTILTGISNCRLVSNASAYNSLHHPLNYVLYYSGFHENGTIGGD